jgi:outer membrane protein assembly factor BamB
LLQLSRPVHRPAFRLLAFAAFLLLLLTACGGTLENANWAGLSSDGRNIYLASGTNVLSFDSETQTTNWMYPVESRGTLLFYSAPSSQSGRVIFGDYGQSGGLLTPRVTVSIYGLEDIGPGTPQQLWINADSARDKIVAPTLQVEDRVYVGTADNHIMALDAVSGAQLWDYETGHAIWGQPTYRDGVLYVSSMDWSVYALNAEDGTLKWQSALGGAIPGRPVLGDSLLYVSSFDSHVHALDIETGLPQWVAPAGDWVWGAPALADGVLYFSDVGGNLFAVDAETGEQLWTRATGASVQTSPVVAAEVLYVASEFATGTDAVTGALTAYSVADGAQIWQQQTPAPLYTNPVIVGDDTIVVAMQNSTAQLIGFDLASGQELWRYAPPGSTN